MVPHRQVQIYLLFSTDNFYSTSQDHVPLCHMILALFSVYSDCVVVPAALYSSYVFPLVLPLCLLVLPLVRVVLTVRLLCLTDWGLLYISQ